MLITNKLEFKEAINNSVSNKVYLQLQEYILNIYSFADYYYLKETSEQSKVGENFNVIPILTLDLLDPNIKELKKYLGLKSSRLEIRFDKDSSAYYILGYKVKQNKNDAIPIVLEGTEIKIGLFTIDSLPYHFLSDIFKDNDYKLTTDLETQLLIDCSYKLSDTKFEFEAFELFVGEDNKSIYINSKLIPKILKIFEDESFLNVNYNPETNVCVISNLSDNKSLYVKCLNKIS